MLRWMSGINNNDQLRNEFIQNRLGVKAIIGKLRETQLRLYGHVFRRMLDGS